MLLPLPAKNVPGGGDFEWTVMPQADCRPVRPLIDSDTARDLIIDDILVAGKSHVGASGGSIPGSLFAVKDLSEILRASPWNKDPNDINKVAFSLPLLKKGTPLTIRGQNRNAAQVRFFGTWVVTEGDFRMDESRWVNHLTASDGYLFAVASDFTLWKKRLAEPGMSDGEWVEIEPIPPKVFTVISENEGTDS